jgi:hypothetical protein
MPGAIEDEELSFGAEEGGVSEPGRLQIGFRFVRCATRVARRLPFSARIGEAELDLLARVFL